MDVYDFPWDEWLKEGVRIFSEKTELMTKWLRVNIPRFLKFAGLVDYGYNSMNIMERLTAMIILGGLAILFMLCVTFFPRQVDERIKKMKEEQKLMNIRERCKKIMANRAILCSRNFGTDQTVPIGALTSDTNIKELRKTIRMLEEAVDREIDFTMEMMEHIQPFITEITGDGVLPDGLSLIDSLGLLKLFAEYLEAKEPVRMKQLREEDITDPLILNESRILKQLLGKLETIQSSKPETSGLKPNKSTGKRIKEDIQLSQPGNSGLKVDTDEGPQIKKD